MAEKTLNRIKNKALNLASTALLRVELTNEESKLKKRFMTLGQKLHGAIRDDLLQTISTFNGWSERGCWVVKLQTLTTLDNSKTGVVETIASEGA